MQFTGGLRLFFWQARRSRRAAREQIGALAAPVVVYCPPDSLHTVRELLHSRLNTFRAPNNNDARKQLFPAQGALGLFQTAAFPNERGQAGEQVRVGSQVQVCYTTLAGRLPPSETPDQVRHCRLPVLAFSPSSPSRLPAPYLATSIAQQLRHDTDGASRACGAAGRAGRATGGPGVPASQRWAALTRPPLPCLPLLQSTARLCPCSTPVSTTCPLALP